MVNSSNDGMLFQFRGWSRIALFFNGLTFLNVKVISQYVLQIWNFCRHTIFEIAFAMCNISISPVKLQLSLTLQYLLSFTYLF